MDADARAAWDVVYNVKDTIIRKQFTTLWRNSVASIELSTMSKIQ